MQTTRWVASQCYLHHCPEWSAHWRSCLYWCSKLGYCNINRPVESETPSWTVLEPAASSILMRGSYSSAPPRHLKVSISTDWLHPSSPNPWYNNASEEVFHTVFPPNRPSSVVVHIVKWKRASVRTSRSRIRDADCVSCCSSLDGVSPLWNACIPIVGRRVLEILPASRCTEGSCRAWNWSQSRGALCCSKDGDANMFPCIPERTVLFFDGAEVFGYCFHWGSSVGYWDVVLPGAEPKCTVRQATQAEMELCFLRDDVRVVVGYIDGEFRVARSKYRLSYAGDHGRCLFGWRLPREACWSHQSFRAIGLGWETYSMEKGAQGDWSYTAQGARHRMTRCWTARRRSQSAQPTWLHLHIARRPPSTGKPARCSSQTDKRDLYPVPLSRYPYPRRLSPLRLIDRLAWMLDSPASHSRRAKSSVPGDWGTSNCCMNGSNATE